MSSTIKDYIINYLLSISLVELIEGSFSSNIVLFCIKLCKTFNSEIDLNVYLSSGQTIFLCSSMKLTKIQFLQKKCPQLKSKGRLFPALNGFLQN